MALISRCQKTNRTRRDLFQIRARCEAMQERVAESGGAGAAFRKTSISESSEA